MKLYKSLLATIALGLCSVALSSCDEDLATPPLSVPSSDLKANMTIADFKAKYWSADRNYCTQVGLTDQGEEIILGGRILANDEGGNIYQNLMLGDETGAITIAVLTNSTDGLKNLYTKYKVGGEMYIRVTGLYAGKYAGLFQIGTAGDYNGTPQTSKMSALDFLAHTELNGLPQPSLVEPLVMTIPEINALKSVEDQQKYQSRLVRVNDVSWIGGGTQMWGDANASSSGTDRYLVDADGQRLLVRNSNKSDFCDQTLPEGHGDVVGILSYYNDKWQFLFRTPADCIDFQGESYAPGGGEAVVNSLDQKFEGLGNISELANWATVNEMGNATWFTQTYDNNTFAACTGYNKSAGADGYTSWLVTPGLDVDNMAEKVFSFTSMVGYKGNGTLEVYAMNSANPATAVLTKLNANIPQPTGSWSEWVASGNIDLSTFSGVVYIGFRYKAAVSAENSYTTYRIDNVLAGKKAEGGDTPTPPDPSGTAQFKKVTSVTSGKAYLIVASGKMAKLDSRAYGYLQVEDVTDNSGIITADPANAYTFTAVSGGYNITMSNGKYVYQTGTYNSFNFGDSAVDGSVWTVTPQSDGSFKIVNVSTSKFIQYDANYTSYGCYSESKGVMPVLYEKVN